MISKININIVLIDIILCEKLNPSFVIINMNKKKGASLWIKNMKFSLLP